MFPFNCLISAFIFSCLDINFFCSPCQQKLHRLLRARFHLHCVANKMM
jgi:hypothetical protein